MLLRGVHGTRGRFRRSPICSGNDQRKRKPNQNVALNGDWTKLIHRSTVIYGMVRYGARIKYGKTFTIEKDSILLLACIAMSRLKLLYSCGTSASHTLAMRLVLSSSTVSITSPPTLHILLTMAHN